MTGTDKDSALAAVPPLTRRPVPSFFAHLGLIWRLRLMVAGNRFRNLSGSAPAVLGGLVLGGISLGLGWGAYSMLAAPAVAASPLWSHFLLRMTVFLVSAVFVTWPILSAGVDEHSELSRFATFPIRPFRLFAASSVSALFEPRAVVFYPAIIGAALGYSSHRPFPWSHGALLIAAYLFFNVAWGRAGLTLVLNVLRHRRSAEILGVVFVGALFLASLAPPIPVDLGWIYALFNQDGAATAALSDRLEIAARASFAIASTPPGALAVGLELAARGYRGAAILRVFDLLFWALVGSAVSFWLLVRFYRGTARPAKPRRERAWLGAGWRDGAFWALIEREASDWLRNPKARLLCAVPFFLCILVKLVSARDLAAAFLGDATDAWLLWVLCTYAGLVVGANFAQNIFAYDGAGLALLYAAPVSLRTIIVAKNVVHTAAALLVSLLLTVFYSLYMRRFDAMSALVALSALAAQMPVLVAVGNYLSVLAPRKFHASLRRRDRPPPVATIVGLAAAAVSIAPTALVMRGLGRTAPGVGSLVLLAFLAALAWLAYLKLLPRACALLETRRETVLRLVMRE